MQHSPTENLVTATDAEVLTEQVWLLYRHFTFMSLANLPTVIIFSYILSRTLGWALVLPWALALTASILLRVRLTYAFKKARPDHTQIGFWARQAVKSTLLSGLLWAVLPPFSTRIDLNTFLVISSLLCMMVAVFLASSSAYRPAFFAFAIPILGSTAFSFLLLVPEHWYAGVLILFGLAIMINLNKYAHRTLVDSIRIRFENRALIDQLTEQKRAAEEANQSKSRFLAAASHDLRQPLHAMNLYFDAVDIAPSEQRRRELFGKIRVAVGTLNSLFDRLLDISRLDAGVVVPSVERCPLKALFDNLNAHFTPVAAEKGLELALEHNNLYVYSDTVLLQQMLDNLVSNAIRYTDEGEVRVGAEQRSESVLIRVRDTGCGIPQHEQRNVFNEFYQLDNPERDRSKGLGLGLSIVRRLCRLTGHAIDIRSETGKGTEFQLRIQAAPAPGTADNNGVTDQPAGYRVEATAAGRETATADLNRFSGLRVLIVDDDVDIRDAMRERLSGWNCRIASADSVEAAREAVAKGFTPDVVLADYRLRNEQTGLEAIRAVEATLGRPVPGVLITGDTAAEPLKKATTSGYRLLHKPIRSDRLCEAISTAVEPTAPVPR